MRHPYQPLTILTLVWLGLWSVLSITDAWAQPKPIKLRFWHAMNDAQFEASINSIVEGFNAANPGIIIELLYTGSYAETLAKAIAAYRDKHPPHIVQIDDADTQTMVDSGATIPITNLIKPGVVDWGDYIAPILEHYTVEGQLLSMPFHSSTAVLYYNKSAFQRAGLDPHHPPDTFAEVEEMGRQLIRAGVARHAISFGSPAWIFEQMHAYHNVPFANHDNGRSQRATEVLFGGEFGVRLVERWKRWAGESLLMDGGGGYASEAAFLAGEVAMLLQATSKVTPIERAAEFPVGTSFMPHIDGLPHGRSLIGGTSLWVFKGFSPEEYDAVVKFFKYLADPEVSARWHRETGSFPVTNAVVKRLLDEGWFQDHPNHLTAFLQILSGVDTPATRGVLLGDLAQIREVVSSALAKALGGMLSAKAALDEAVRASNRILTEAAELR